MTTMSRARSAYDPRDSKPGTLWARSVVGSVVAEPTDGRTITFGREKPDVNVCIGEHDTRVSRQHGTVTRTGGLWFVRNTGLLPIGYGDFRYLREKEDPIPLGDGYTALSVAGRKGRSYVLELYVTGPHERRRVRHHDITVVDKWDLSDRERAALAFMAEAYLRDERFPQPRSYKQVAESLNALGPDEKWSHKRVENLIKPVQKRLTKGGVEGLTSAEISGPVGNSLNHNLITALIVSASLVPDDLDRLI